jgi:transposase
MFVRVKTYPNNHQAVQIVESIRDNGIVRQKILRHVGRAQSEIELTKLKELADFILTEMQIVKEPTIFPTGELAQMVRKSRAKKDENPIAVNLKQLREEHRIVTGIHDIYGKLYDETGFDKLLKGCPVSKHVLRDITLARIARPCSKMASSEMLGKDFGITHSLSSIYRMMDQLDQDKITRLQTLCYEHTRSLFGNTVSVLFYDCTTLYFESFTEDELKEFGYSKDHKFNQSQILLALLVTTEGLPIGYEVFNGSMFEGNTLETMLYKIKKQYQLTRAIFVADSALLSKNNIEKLEENNIEYIVGARLKSLSKHWQDEILDNKGHFKEQKEGDIIRHSSFKYDTNRQLIVSHSQKRAEKDRLDREKAIDRLRARLSKSTDMKTLISNYGYQKYIKAINKANVEIDLDKVNQDAQWDGLHGVFTNITGFDPQQILSHYRGLWQVEESFRISKHDLRMRPIFHWTPRRIKAHIAICFMAFSLIRILQFRLRREYKLLSPEKVREDLYRIQSSILINNTTNERYVIPSKPGLHTSGIYKTLAMQYNAVPYRLSQK